MCEEGRVKKGGHNPPNTSTNRPPAPGGSGGSQATSSDPDVNAALEMLESVNKAQCETVELLVEAVNLLGSISKEVAELCKLIEILRRDPAGEAKVKQDVQLFHPEKEGGPWLAD